MSVTCIYNVHLAKKVYVLGMKATVRFYIPNVRIKKRYIKSENLVLQLKVHLAISLYSQTNVNESVIELLQGRVVFVSLHIV